MNPRLLALLESGDLDWDDPRHREMYLRAWVKAGNRAFLEAVRDR